MRKITSHQVNECNTKISIEADDQNPQNGNASHDYDVTWTDPDGSGMSVEIPFQNGPIKEVGVNGLTHEVLLAIIIDRLEGFQTSQWACAENECALVCLRTAVSHLESRTKAREARGVEGTHTV